MYSEKTYKNYIFWLQVRRIFVIIILSILGAALGILIGKILESTIKVKSFNNIIIAVSTIIFFLISLLLTIGTGKQVQDGYWRIAVLRKLTVIQKNLELNNELLKNANSEIKSKFKPIDNLVKKEDKENIDKKEEKKSEIKEQEQKELIQSKDKNHKKKKLVKTLKTPEVISK